MKVFVNRKKSINSRSLRCVCDLVSALEYSSAPKKHSYLFAGKSIGLIYWDGMNVWDQDWICVCVCLVMTGIGLGACVCVAYVPRIEVTY